MQRLLGYMLTNAGYEVEEASNGPEALEVLGETPPDLIFLDIMMPEMDGFEVLRQIRERYEMKSLPVIILTAKAQDVDRETAMRAGANEYLTKPYTSEEVLQVAQAYLADIKD
jgi:CheY-like chemotaxis protein